MVLVAAELRQAYVNRDMNSGNRATMLDQSIFRLRQARSDKMVQNLTQYRALDVYSQALLEGRFDTHIARERLARAPHGGRPQAGLVSVHVTSPPPVPRKPPGLARTPGAQGDSGALGAGTARAPASTQGRPPPPVPARPLGPHNARRAR
jgi:hypothetical protein